MNGTHKVLAYADDATLLGDDIRTIKSNADVFFNTCKDIGLAENTRKTKYIQTERHRGMISNDHIRISSNSYFKYLGFLVTNQNSIQEEIKSRLKAGNVLKKNILNSLVGSALIQVQGLFLGYTMVHSVVGRSHEGLINDI